MTSKRIKIMGIKESTEKDTKAEEVEIEIGQLLGSLSPGTDNPLVALRQTGVYPLTGEISEDTLKDIQNDMLLKAQSEWEGEFVLLINSHGGLLHPTWALIDIIKWIKPETRTSVIGVAYSAAAMILAAGARGKRLAAPNSAIMIHSYSAGAWGSHKDLLADRKWQDDEYRRELSFWMEHSKHKSKKAVEKYLLRDSDVFLTPKEALQHGIIDEITRVRHR